MNNMKAHITLVDIARKRKINNENVEGCKKTKSIFTAPFYLIKFFLDKMEYKK